MDFFDRHKALIITILFCSVVLLGLYNFNLSQNNAKTKELLVNLENFQIEEPVEEPEEEQEQEDAQPRTNRETAQTHRAFNENEEAREENFDQQLQEIFEKNSASQEETTNDESSATSGNYGLQQQKKPEVKKRSDGDRSSDKISAKTGGMDHSSISFSLVGRTARNIPNPIYTCDREGKVVVNITVNDEGRVLSTSINKGSSSTTNECLTEQAMQYAAQAVFSRLPGRKSQPGTITYNFKP